MDATGALKIMKHASTKMYLLTLLSHCLLIKIMIQICCAIFMNMWTNNQDLTGKVCGKNGSLEDLHHAI